MPPIKAFLGRIRSHRILLKLLMSFVVPAVTLVIVITLFFSYWFSKESIDYINSTTHLALSNVSIIFSNMLESSKRTAYEVYNNPNVREFLFSRDISKDNFLNTARYLKYVTLANDKIFSIYVYNSSGKILDMGGDININESTEDIVSLIQSVPVFIPFPRQITNRHNEKTNVVTFIYNELGNENELPPPTVIVNMKADSLYKMISTKNLDNSRQIIITDSAGQIIMHSNMELFTRFINKETYYMPASDSSPDHGNMEMDVDGVKSIVNYIFLNDKRFTVYFITDYNSFFSKTIRTRNIIVYTCLAILMLVFAVTVFLSYSIYTPLNNIIAAIRNLLGVPTCNGKDSTELKYISGAVSSIIERLNNLERDQAGSHDLLRKNFLYSLFISQEPITEEHLREQLSKFEIIDDFKNKFRIFVLRISGLRHFYEDNTTESIYFQLASIEDIVCKIISQSMNCRFLTAECSHMVFVAGPLDDKRHSLEMIVSLITESQKTILQLFNIKVTAGISDFSNDLSVEQLRIMYKQAYELTNYRLVYGKLSVLHTEAVKPVDVKNDKIFNYIDSAVNALKSGSIDQYKRCIGLLFTAISNNSYEKIVSYIILLARAILQVPDNLHINLATISVKGIDDLYNTIVGFEDYQELENWFTDLYLSINEAINSFKTRKAEDMIESVIKFIESNYADSMISANLMAEKINVTPQYFSKLFKESTGMYFPEYINNLRLEKAKELLTNNPNLSIRDICEKTGYNSSTYFATSFAKKYGLPPTKYIQLLKE